MIRATPGGRTQESFACPFFVSPHAVDRYRQRVRRGATAADAIAEVQRALQGRLVYPPPCTLAVCDRQRRFVAIVAPPLPDQEWPSVVTIYAYNQYLWKSKGVPKKRRVPA